MPTENHLATLYENRFDKVELAKKNAIWQVLCSHFFQKYVRKTSVVLDVGAGHCEFINNIQCSEKYAVDLNKNTLHFAAPKVKVFNYPSTDLSFLANGSIDVVFMSNFLEHLESKEDIVTTLFEAFRVLRDGGLLMILQPNIRYLYREYWDFFDHHIPLSDRSLTEALKMVGFTIEQIIPKFLPYTTKSKVPRKPFSVKIYLRIPLVWKLMGKQMFVLGRKPCITQ